MVAASHPLLIIARLVLFLGAFVLPGAALAGWILRRRGGVSAQLVVGAALSFALFGLLAWPFLWYRLAFDDFVHLLTWIWPLFGAFAGVAGIASVRLREADPDDLPVAAPPITPRHELDRKAVRQVAWYLALVSVALFLYAYVSPLRGVMLRLLPLFLLPGFSAARHLRRIFSTVTHQSPRDHEAPPRLWTIAAAVAIAVQVVGIAVYNRPDWDDCYYLAAVLDYEQAQVLNDEEPSHRENLPVPTQHRTLCWELFGAVLCKLTGATPSALFHTFLPVPLLLLAYAAYTMLLRELLPRRYVPLGLLALSALHLWGISSHTAAANFLLPRLGQAKSVLLHVCMPLSVALLLRFFCRPDARLVLGLLATVVFGLSISLSAIFVLLGLLGCLTLALLCCAPTWRRRVELAVAAALATAPLFAAGLLMRAAMRGEVGLQARPTGSDEWLPTVANFLDRGTAELSWFLTLPLLAVLLPRRDRDRQRRAYLFLFPTVVAATLVNPLLFHFVAGGLTSYHTYPRLLWLFPVAPSLAVLLALGCRAVSRLLDGDSLSLLADRRPLKLALGGLLLTMALPGLFVFGSGNSYIGPLGTPSLAANLDKLPDGLPQLAAKLDATPGVSDTRILCNEQIASFLTPYSRAFRFVQTRPLYTPVLFSGAGRTDEGVERALLASVLRRGQLSPQPSRDEFFELHMLFGEAGVSSSFGSAMAKASRDPQTLLDRYRVRHAITGPGDHADVAVFLRKNGFHPVAEQGPFTLWQRGESRRFGQ